MPFTARFQLVGPTALASPFMPLLAPHCSLEYTVAFVRPHAAESDFVWDNFQDQVVIQTRLSKLVVQLQALKESDEPEPASFFPQSLPSIKAPALKLFEYIETTHRRDASKQATRRLDTVSESFNGSKNKAESALEPIHGRSSITSSSSSSNHAASPADDPQVPSHSLTADVNTQAEAKAIILKLRARNSTRSGAAAVMPPAPSNECSRLHLASEDSVPEIRLDATTRAELDAFHQLVVGAKDCVMREQVAAKSELEYYRQFLPQAPATDISSSSDEITPRELQSSSGSSAPSLQPLVLRSAVAGCPATTTAMAPLKLTKVPQAIKATGKLPTPATIASASITAAPGVPLCDDEGESNQETSPVRKSVAPTTKQPPSSMTRQSIAPAKSSSSVSNKPMTRTSKAKASEPTQAIRPSASNNAVMPLQGSSSLSSRGITAPLTKTATLRSKPLSTTAVKGQAKPKPKQQPQQKSRDYPEAALSDFDDLDPDVDDAPVLPDDLTGMRTAAFGGGDCDDDEY